jgi:hypothetical protein
METRFARPQLHKKIVDQWVTMPVIKSSHLLFSPDLSASSAGVGV